MKPTLVENLRDPVSLEPLKLGDHESSPAGEILSGDLLAPSGTRYRIEDGVPLLVRPDQFAEGQGETVESFSWKWRRAQNYRGATIGHYSQWYLDRYGFSNVENLGKFLSGKKRVLDAGTAHGRDAEMYAKNSPATVFGIDISFGVKNAYRDLGALPNAHFVQADLTRLPFPEGFFDFIGCDQVIHHTPSTRKSLAHLVTRLAPGGHIAFYVYKKKGPVREFCDDHIRSQTVNMTPEECYKVSEAITKFGKMLSDLKLEIEVPEDIPVLEIKAGKYDLQRFLYWNMFKMYWNDTMDWESNVITNFDWYHPLHAHRHTKEEVETWCKEENLTIQHLDIQESGISVLARKAGQA
jgi:SAM-dependent methyltransferase